MERLEAKKVSGHTYYYYSEWGWVNGKCRRKWQKYLGKLEDIVKACEGGGPTPACAEIFQWGLPAALWRECSLANVAAEVDALCPKRNQGLTTGQYLAIAALNRAIRPQSKRSMGEWFSQTVLLRYLPEASKEALSSQRFWDHMDRIDADRAAAIWKSIVKHVVRREELDLSSISYDGTNFYTFLDTFNLRCQIAKRGKNKQGRNNLRQINYALFCCADGHMPLFYDVYEGNRHDAKEFPLILQRFNAFLGELCAPGCGPADITLIFDKGNNSTSNFALIDEIGLHFVGSAKLDEHPELARISNEDARFVPCEAAGLEGTKALRVEKVVYGQQRIVVVSFNQNLFHTQWLTLQNDIHKALEQLCALRQKLQDRSAGLIQRGLTPTVQSVRKQCEGILTRQYLKQIINVQISEGPQGAVQLDYTIDSTVLNELSDTHLGKTLIITDRALWDDARIIQAYRSQFIIENVFKEMKDRKSGTWWPLHHWTDSKIRVHGLYCTIALLLRALMWRRITKAKVPLSMKRLLSELDDIREVINIYPKRRGQKTVRRQSVLSKTTELQDKLITILGLKKEAITVLG